jgi:hypothetical protein
MNEQQPDTNAEPGIFDNYSDTQKEILEMETRKTRNKLFTLAIIAFASDFLGLLVADAVTFQTLLFIAVVPAILVGLAFLALKEPLTSMIIAAILFAGLWIYTISIMGGRAAISGWLVKAIVIYMLIAGFQNALEAHRIKRELKV